MENTFDLKKFLVENKLTSNSKMLNEAVEVQHGGRDGTQILVVPDNIKIQVTDYDEATDKDINTGTIIGAPEIVAALNADLEHYYDSIDINTALEYMFVYNDPKTRKPMYNIRLKFKQVGDKLEVDPTSVTAELPAKD